MYERTEAQHQNIDIFFVIIKQKVVVEIYRDKKTTLKLFNVCGLKGQSEKAEKIQLFLHNHPDRVDQVKQVEGNDFIKITSSFSCMTSNYYCIILYERLDIFASVWFYKSSLGYT